MIPQKNKNRKWRKYLGLLAAVVVLVLPLTTRAGIIDGIVGLALDPIYDIILSLINMVVNFIGTVLIGLAASIVNYTFNFPNFVTSPVVQIGWSVSRDLANMAFILIMLGIAFAYILDLDIYGVKKMIVPLIVMALLLNFSLIIGGVFIDIGNSLGKFFVSGGAGNSTGVGDGIMAAVQAGQLAQIRNNVAASSPISNLIMASVFQLVFYIILAFMLFAMGFVMLYRIVNLWILLILAPLAWVCVAVPNMKSYYSQWWSKFLKWAFYPVGLGFFVYIGTLAGASLFGADLSGGNFVRDTGGLAWLLPDTSISLVLQFIVVVMILMMGLAVSESWAGKSGKMVMDWGKSAQNWGLGKLKSGTRAIPGTAVKTADRFTGGAVSRGLATGLERLEKAPLIGRAIGGPGARFQRQQKALKDAEGKLKGLRPQDLRAILNQVAITPEGQARRAAALSQLADKGQLKDEDKKHIQDFQAAGGNIKDLLERRLDWALDEVIQNLMAKDINNPAMADAWKKVVAEASGTAEKLAEVKKAIQNSIPKKPEDLAKMQKETITATDKDTEAAKKAKEEIKGFITDEFKDGGRLYVNSLSALANKNPETYYQLMTHINKMGKEQPQVYATIKKEVKNHIEAGPLFQASIAAETPTTPPATATAPGTTPP